MLLSSSFVGAIVFALAVVLFPSFFYGVSLPQAPGLLPLFAMMLIVGLQIAIIFAIVLVASVYFLTRVRRPGPYLLVAHIIAVIFATTLWLIVSGDQVSWSSIATVVLVVTPAVGASAIYHLRGGQGGKTTRRM